MVMRKCSQCGNAGHYSRTCSKTDGQKSVVSNNIIVGTDTGTGVRLFGVQLVDHLSSSSSSSPPSIDSINRPVWLFGVQLVDHLTSSSSSSPSIDSMSYKSRNMGCPSTPSTTPISPSSSYTPPIGHPSDKSRPTRDRKKGVPWTTEEHQKFLAGLKELRKGNWISISKRFVTTRTPTQVASHAQKYFLRQNPPLKRKLRRSLFDLQVGTERTNSDSHSREVKVRKAHHQPSKPVGLIQLQSTIPSSAPDDLELKLGSPTPVNLTNKSSRA